MKRISLGVLSALLLATVLIASLAWAGTPAALAQETGAAAALRLDVTIELADGDVITLPLTIAQEDLFALLELPAVATAVEAVAPMVGQEMQTITVAVPAIFTPTAAALHIVSSVPAVPEPPITTTLAITVPAPAPMPAVDLVPIATANANLRAAPTTSANIVGQASTGQALMIRARNVDRSWYQLADGSWVAAFLVENAPQDLPIVVDGGVVLTETVPATVTSQALVLRAGPAADENSLGSYAEDTVVAVVGLSPDGDWLEVVTPDGKQGWMSAAFLELSVPQEALPESAVSALPASITGVVVDKAGKGIGGIVVTASSPSGDKALSVEATTGEDGAFVLDLAAGSTGTWAVEITGVGCASRIVNERCQLFGYYAAVPAAKADVTASEAVTLTYAEAVSFIAGSVVDAEGNALQGGVRVAGEREDGARTSGETSSSGKFVLPAAPGVWTVSTEGGPSVEVKVPERSAPEPIELTRE